MTKPSESCHRWRHHLVEAVCDELTSVRRRELEHHLESCAGCAAELEGLRSAARSVDELLPARPEGTELDLWRRILPEIEDLERAREPRRLLLGYPAAAALATMLLVFGLGLGWLARSSAPTGPEELPAIPGTPAVAGLDAEYARYLERATPLLLEIANRQVNGFDAVSHDGGGFGPASFGPKSLDPKSLDPESFDPEVEQRLAERLATDAEALARRLDEDGRGRQAKLTAELGRVFLQMANLPREEYRRGLEVVRATIETRSLLFQLSVEEMRL